MSAARNVDVEYSLAISEVGAWEDVRVLIMTTQKRRSARAYGVSSRRLGALIWSSLGSSAPRIKYFQPLRSERATTESR